MEIQKSLAEVFPPDKLSFDASERQEFGKDWTTYFDIDASAIFFPTETADVKLIVEWANKNRVPLVPSGGRTGLSGGAVASRGEVVVNLSRMNRILEFNPIDQTVLLEAGVVTEELQKFAESKDLFYPVDFAAKGSSQIAGNIATNAGGIKVLRYGLTRNWVQGLEVVTGTGAVLELNRNLVKNATGYDFRHLLIGSEGTLGFITKAWMKLAPRPGPLRVFLGAVSQLDDVMNVFEIFQKNLSLTAYEFFSRDALKHVLANTDLTEPFAASGQSETPFYVVIEIEAEGSAAEMTEEKILEIFEQCLEKSWLTDGVLSQNESQAKTLWRYREDISESLAKRSPYKNDLSVRPSRVPQFLNELTALIRNAYPNWETIWFGHIGDGNLHLNILRPPELTKEEFVQLCREVDPKIFSIIQKYEGSLSAEHGVGLTKKPFLGMSRSAEEITLMREIKKIFDPNGILNPGKIFDLGGESLATAKS